MKKIIIGTILGCLILLGCGVTAGAFLKSVEAKTNTGHPNDLEVITDKTTETNFTKKLKTALEKEGYNTISYIIIEQTRKESRVTVQISDSEYKGKQTENKIRKTVNQLAEENHIGSFLVYVKTKS